MDKDWELLSGPGPGQGHGPGPPESPELEGLRQQAEIYKEDFFRERQAREEAERKTKELEAAVAALKKDLTSKEQQIQELHAQSVTGDDERQTMMRKEREAREEARLLRQQVETLQERLRQMERERRALGMHMQQPMRSVLQPWACHMCTFQNAAGASQCGMCRQPAPERDMPLPPWRDRVVCD